MRFFVYLIAASVCSATLWASTIDVSQQTTQLLQSGDSLEFLFSDSSYARNVSSLGLPDSPSQIFFNFVSLPASSSGQFTAEVTSEDGSVSAMFPGSIGWTSGVVQTSGYNGAASVAMDSLTLSSQISDELFAGTEAELTLFYTGPDITVGLPGDTLKSDLTISLVGGPLSIGAMDYGVSLTNNASVPAPEPNSSAMMLAAGAFLCAVSGVLKRFGRPRA